MIILQVKHKAKKSKNRKSEKANVKKAVKSKKAL